MEVVSLKPFFRASHFYLRKSNRPECSHFSLHSKLSLRRRPSPRKPQKFRALASRSDPNEPWNNPFSLFLPILVSRVPKLSPFLLGGRGRGAGGEEYACSGGIGLVLMSTSAAAVAKSRVSPFLCTLAGNPTFVSGLMAWALAQTLKMLLHFFFVERRWDFGMLFSSGGMPSSHSALCMALTASVALCHGVSDALFPVCLGFSLIVMYDAIGVRRHAGMQAEVLNKIIEDLFQGHPISERKLKELLGHTPSQVVAGAVLGILVACICCQGFVVSV